MTESMATGWYYVAKGTGDQRVGPLTWAELYTAGSSGSLQPDDLVWHPTMPEWLPASSVPGLPTRSTLVAAAPTAGVAAYEPVAQPAAYYSSPALQPATPREKRRRSWLLPVLVPLVVLILVGGGLGSYFGFIRGDEDRTDGTPGTPGTSETAVEGTATDDMLPLIDLIAVAPTVIDVPYTSTSFTATPEAGGTAAYEGLVVSVPVGAVKSETTVEVKNLTMPFHMEVGEEAVGEDAALCVGSIYDLGPEGLAFDHPVTITLPYDESALPTGVSEETVHLVYWNGQEWTVCEELVDTESNTVTAQFESFKGVALATAAAVTALAGIILYTGKVIYDKVTDPERVNTDAVKDNTASQHVTPDDPTVQEWAGKAMLRNASTGELKALDDPGLAAWVADSCKKHQKPTLVYPNGDTLEEFTSRYDKGVGSNWQTPAHYFTEGTREHGPLAGDCTDTTNAAVSVLVARGFHAKGVYGFGGKGKDKGTPHAWGEVLIGDQVYRVDEAGSIITPDNCSFHFDEYKPVTDPADPHYECMWDANGQEVYDPDWWEKSLALDLNGHWAGSITITSYTVSDPEAVQAQGEEGCGLAIGMAIIEKILNVPIPTTIDIMADDYGNGSSAWFIDLQSVFNQMSAEGGEGGAIEVGDQSQTVPFTYSGTKLTFVFEESSSTSITGTLIRKGNVLVIEGAWSTNENGIASTAVFSVTKKVETTTTTSSGTSGSTESTAGSSGSAR